MKASSIILRALAFDGPDKPTASVAFSRGLNVICGASDTGKSFVAESIDYMLGGGETPRDIPERVGYDKAALTVEVASEGKTYRLVRSTGGGDFHRFDVAEIGNEPFVLRAKHAAGRDDSLSAWLLSIIGLPGKKIRTNAAGELRSLSFRDVARLVILQQGEISSKTSPYLTGQYVSKTAEYSALKLLLTGVDDSTMIIKAKPASEAVTTAAKIEVIDSVIAQLQEEVADAKGTASELADQLKRLQESMATSNAALRQTQQRLDSRMKSRRDTYQHLESVNGRLDEIGNLLARFSLLDRHYQVDLQRLSAISEAGHFISHMPNGSCPLCGAAPEQQHIDEQCDGNVVSVAEAAEAEQQKVRHLLVELGITVRDLETEAERLKGAASEQQDIARRLDKEISETLSPAVGELRGSYSSLVEKASDIRRLLTVFDRIAELEGRKVAILSSPEGAPGTPGNDIVTDVSKSVLHALSLGVERILAAWNFPGASRVTFDDRTCDFVCDGKPRASFGAGFRAIISAAASIGLLEYCLEHDRPHPGFLVLESPLLAYWKPESSSDDLKGTDLKDRFYEYLNTMHAANQIVIIENEHPLPSLALDGRLTVFTRNPLEGRYGLFPMPLGVT